MKSGGVGGGGNAPTKRRWRGLVLGVLGLVLLSMLVPLVFLLGFHNGFQSPGFVSEQSSASNPIRGYIKDSSRDTPDLSEGDQSRHVDDLVRRLAPTLSKDIFKKSKPKEETIGGVTVHDDVPRKASPAPAKKVPRVSPTINTRADGPTHITKNPKYVDESGKQCELKYGSFCLWRQEHKEEMKDSMVKKLKDKLFVARAYYPTIAKLPAQDKLSREMKQNIQEFERILSETSTDADLPSQVQKKLQKMDAVIARAKSFPVDCNNVDKKLRQIFDMTEDEANFHMRQSSFLYQLAVQTMPKSLHCLSMRLTVDYFKSPSDVELSLTEKYMDPALQHYVIFSKNVLASSAVINSTVMHAKESVNQVFHVLTNGQNYYAMKQWFIRNTYKEATVRVLNIEALNLENQNLELSLPVEFRVSFHSVDNPPVAQMRTEYLSTFSHSHYLLPQIFQNLKRVVVLDDDVIVQQDLSALWSLNMGGKVNGAVQMCSVRLNLLKSYLGERSFDKNSCVWMSGLNVIDLDKWREVDLTETYGRLLKELSMGEGLSEAVASLLSFQDLIYVLDDAWALSGLGYDYGLDIKAIKRAAVLHYNGNMKPWLDLGIPKYRHYWKNFRNQEDQFLSECNVSP
ncbi:probable galacturonosyltransferase 7 isoform X2 [Morus notabilis]|uniref:probable galacturonosyltransferase 7 isoform X2 n=1 Tax=Morus notabilis TaxID=981085 RepID=UPI000CED6F04|nr:probable galacturonosyltransferase 7 isoform X2 [Morus notabilis]